MKKNCNDNMIEPFLLLFHQEEVVAQGIKITFRISHG